MIVLIFPLWLIVFHQSTAHKDLDSKHCRFSENFYNQHSSVFQLNSNRTSLTVRALYDLSNQSIPLINQSLSIGIIYRLANTFLAPVPLLFQCGKNDQWVAPTDCQMTIVDARTDSSQRTAESTRTSTVPLHYQHSSPRKFSSLRGAYFRESTVVLRNCRFTSKLTIDSSETFHLHIEFEQTIGSPCDNQCSHSTLYQCSLLSKTCQCRSHESGVEAFGHLCIDTELGSNCSLTPERCRRFCPVEKKISTDERDTHCQCPLGTRRVFSKNIHRCELPTLIECDQNNVNKTCGENFICLNHRCVSLDNPIPVHQSILPIPLILIGLLIAALLIIIVLIIGLLKMRSIKCVKFIHPAHVLTHSANSSPATITRLSVVPSSSSPCSTLSSSSKSVQLSSTGRTIEKYTKIDLFE